jgi:hypothetical protein
MVPDMTSLLRALSLLCLTACTQFPSVDAAAAPDLVRPSLLPTRDLAVDQIAPLSEDPLAARAATLRARADALRSR